MRNMIGTEDIYTELIFISKREFSSWDIYPKHSCGKTLSERSVEPADTSFPTSFVASSMLLPALPGIISSTQFDKSGNKPFIPSEMPENKIMVRIELGMNTKTAQTFAID